MQTDFMKELEHLTDEQLIEIQQKANSIRTSRDNNGFFAATFKFKVGVKDTFVYYAKSNELCKETPNGLERSRYQFLLDAANKPRNGKPFVVKSILDYMIEILTAVRNQMV